jgi:hypothetical protein
MMLLLFLFRAELAEGGEVQSKTDRDDLNSSTRNENKLSRAAAQLDLSLMPNSDCVLSRSDFKQGERVALAVLAGCAVDPIVKTIFLRQ